LSGCLSSRVVPGGHLAVIHIYQLQDQEQYQLDMDLLLDLYRHFLIEQDSRMDMLHQPYVVLYIY
jgi:hypothetical protein